MVSPIVTEDKTDVPLPFFGFLEPSEREQAVFDAYHRHIAPYHGRQEICSLESCKLYVCYLHSLCLKPPLNKFPWVPVGSVGCLPIIGHLDPLRFEKSAPLPQWFAPRVLLTEAFYLRCMERLAECLEDDEDPWYAKPIKPLPRVCPTFEDPRDTLLCLADHGIFPVDRLARQRDQLVSWYHEDVDDRMLVETLSTDSALTGFDAALKYLEETQPCLDVRDVSVDPALQVTIPQSLAEQHELVAYVESERATFVLSPFTERFHLGDLIAQKRGGDREVFMVLVSEHHQRSHLSALEGLRMRQTSLDNDFILESTEDSGGIRQAEIEIDRRGMSNLDLQSGDCSNEQLVQWLLFQAITMGASDVHIEQTGGMGRVRMRVDGSLITVHRLGLTGLKGLLAMIKNSCGMNPSHLDTDDNRFAVTMDDKLIDVRVSAVPFRRDYQKMVLRLLNKGSGFKRLEVLGLPEHQEAILRHAGKQKQGLILVTGPTGSGKSTTLYALLDAMNTSDVNIHTIEDPIEYELDDLNQTQVNHQRELSYERVLRSLLRQDPDIIMVGEIRDRETAEAATNAALTGHLVLSTVHSLSALKAVRRLTQMGVPSYMVAESLILLQAQRLVRKLCDCKRPISVSKVQAKQFEQHAPYLCDHLSNIYEPGGCSACLNTGFKGRLALMELCPIDDALGEMIAEGATTIELHRAASDVGFRALFSEALDHCAKGDISFEVAMELSQAW